MKNPNTSDEEIRAVARELAEQNQLSIARVQERTGGRTSRVAQLVREVKAERESALAENSADDGNDTADAQEQSLLPTKVAKAMSQLAQAVATSLYDARQEEGERARTAEEALRAQHREALDERQRIYDEAKAENEELAELVDQVQERAARLEGQTRELRETVQQRDEQMETLRQEQKSERNRLETTVDELRTELRQAQTAQRDAQVARAEAMQELRDVRADLEVEGQRYSASQEALNRATAGLDHARAERAEAEERASTAQRDLAEAREQIAALQAKLESATQIEQLALLLQKRAEETAQQEPPKKRRAKGKAE